MLRMGLPIYSVFLDIGLRGTVYELETWNLDTTIIVLPFVYLFKLL